MDPKDIELLEKYGWMVECESPFEIRDKDGNFASGIAAKIVLDFYRDQDSPPPTYFVLRKYNCGTLDMKTGKVDSDIIGITTNEDYAKEKRSVFCNYEPVISLD